MHLRLVCRLANVRFSDRSNHFHPDEKDLVVIGGGVAGYVAAIKAGQEGMKVRNPYPLLP